MGNKILIILIIISFFIGAYILVTHSNEIVNIQITPVDSQSNIHSLERIVQDASPSVVSIIIKTKMDIYRNDPYSFFEQIVGQTDIESGLGSGFFVSNDGYIITSKHVIDNSEAEYMVVLQNGEQYSSEIVYQSDDKDIALIKINSDFQVFSPLKIRSSENIIKVGESVVAIGNTLSQNDNSVSFGTVSAVDGFLQTDILLFPGNSGGPLIGSDGKVIGINTAIDWSQSNAGLATQINSKMIEGYLDIIK